MSQQQKDTARHSQPIEARAQRLRWIRGVNDANQQFAGKLLMKGIRTRDLALLDGALQAYMPPYSILTAYTAFLFLLNLAVNAWLGRQMPLFLIVIWMVFLIVLFLYPFFGLILEKAPLKAYLVILTAPVFMVWRIWLAGVGRFGRSNITWVRTAHKGR